MREIRGESSMHLLLPLNEMDVTYRQTKWRMIIWLLEWRTFDFDFTSWFDMGSQLEEFGNLWNLVRITYSIATDHVRNWRWGIAWNWRNSLSFPTLAEIGEDLACVLDKFEVKSCMAFGEGAGANIICRFAVSFQRKKFTLAFPWWITKRNVF